MKLICFIKGIFRSIINFNIISGHDYIEIYDNKDIQVLRCELCGHISVGFKAKEVMSKWQNVNAKYVEKIRKNKK